MLNVIFESNRCFSRKDLIVLPSYLRSSFATDSMW